MISIAVGYREINDQSTVVNFADVDNGLSPEDSVGNEYWLAVVSSKLGIEPANLFYFSRELF